ncbi:MAG TPA: hypothetical protein PKA49_08590 [Tepidiformaceae bacterium]|nr:hypothetical protein [Tepidiformaceae bacterium]
MTGRPRPRLSAAHPATFQMRSFWLERLSYDEYAGIEPTEPAVRISRPELLQSDLSAQEVVVRIRIELGVGDRMLDATCCGRFDSGGLTEEEAAPFVTVNAPVMLLGAFRGVVAVISSLGSAGRLDLPALDLTSHAP